MKNARRRKTRTAVLRQGQVTQAGDIAPVRPKAGPGVVLKPELIDMRSGMAKRFRNIAVSPLVLAHYRGHLCAKFDVEHPKDAVTPDERYDAGLQIEKLWAQLHVSNLRDSSTPGISSHAELFLTERKEEAGRRLRAIAARMERKDWLVVIKFCGEQWPAPQSLRHAGIPHDHHSVWPRICEALDALVYTTTGRTPPGEDAFRPSAASVSHLARERDATVA
jgi:hypothetical protein